MIHTANFIKSSPNVELCPEPIKPEYAFIGRSNVGKSSLINMLTGHKALAKVSGSPGKTQLINHFEINGGWYLVDLPGYGYAKVPKSVRKQFSLINTNYILKRENLFCLFVLIDSRLEPQAVDQAFTRWLGEEGIPFALAFTKADKLGKTKLEGNIDSYKKVLEQTWEELPPIFITSAMEQNGKEDILGFIKGINDKHRNE